jgi:iron complex outermembrane receptor protein
VAKDRTFYQDLHLAGEALKGDLDWLAGVDYLIQHDLNGTDSATTPCVPAGRGHLRRHAEHPAVLPADADRHDVPATFPAAFGTSARAPLRNESKSAYGLVRYHTNGFTLAGELRYSDDKKKAAQETVLLYTSTPPRRARPTCSAPTA